MGLAINTRQFWGKSDEGKQMERGSSISALLMMNKKHYVMNKRIVCLSNSSPHNKQIKKYNSFVHTNMILFLQEQEMAVTQICL